MTDVKPAESTDGRSRYPHFLVVDDEQCIRDLFQVYFADRAAVTVADSAEAALEQISRHHFDAIISDVDMPGTCGISLFRKLRTRDPEISRRFVFCSGSCPPELNDLCTRHEITFICKPISFHQLQERLARLLEPAPSPDHDTSL
jgi:DNA-binding NtrC family response regulator